MKMAKRGDRSVHLFTGVAACVKCKKGVLKPCKCDKANRDGLFLHLRCDISNKDGALLHVKRDITNGTKGFLHMTWLRAR